MRVYLDICCLNRPFDDPAQDRIRLEAEAVLLILERTQEEAVDLVASEAMEAENDRNPDRERRRWVAKALSQCRTWIEVDSAVERRAGELSRLGFGAYDSLRKAGRRLGKKLAVTIENPVEWVSREEHTNHDGR